jgi:O-antigen/teichoic acid export membrane protein
LTNTRHNLAPLLRGRAAALVIVATVSASFADLVTMIGGLFMPADDVAVLGVSIRLAALAGFVTQATQNFILPDLANALTRGTRSEVHALLLRINGVALVAILACIALAALAGDQLLGIFGEQYKVGHWPLVCFMISQGFRAASGMNQHLLSIDGHQAKTASSCALAVSTLFAVAALLAPAYGVMGMAIAAVIADAVWAILLAIQSGRHTGRRGDILALLRERP